MASGADPSRSPAGPVVSAVAMLATAGLVYVGTGLHALWWATWLIPLPLLLLAPHRRPRLMFVLAWVAWMLGMGNLWTYATTSIGVPALLVALFVLGHAALIGVSVCLFSWMHRTGRPGSAVLVIASAAVVLDYAESTLSPHGTFLSPSYTQADHPLVLSFAAVGGGWAITGCSLPFRRR